MGPRYLSVPAGGPPSAYVGSTVNLRTLYGALVGVSQDVAINQAGEGCPVELPNGKAMAQFVAGGGVLVDYCGWPMWYVWDNGAWQPSQLYPGGVPTGSAGQTFLQFLQNVGVDSAYIRGFTLNTCGYFYSIFGCLPCAIQNYPYDRSAVSIYDFPTAGSVIIAPASPRGSCKDNTGQTNDTFYAYPMIGVKAASGGWYFYAYSKGGLAVDPTVYANFIRQALGYAPSSGTGGGGGTSGGGGGTVPPGGGAGTTPSTGGLSTGAKVAIVVGGLALLGGIVLLTTGGG